MTKSVEALGMMINFCELFWMLTACRKYVRNWLNEITINSKESRFAKQVIFHNRRGKKYFILSN